MLNWCIVIQKTNWQIFLHSPTLANLLKRIQVLPNTTQHAGELEMHRRCLFSNQIGQSTVQPLHAKYPRNVSMCVLLFVSTT